MKNIDQWITVIAAVVTSGFATMLLVQLVKQPVWPSWLKLILSIGVSLLVGLGTVWLSGGLTEFIASWGHLSAAQVLSVGAVVFAAAQTFYHLYFRNSSWMQALADWPRSVKGPVA